MKKLLLIGLVLLACVLIFTACGGETNTTTEPGLYDANNNLIASWDELVNTYGMRVDVDYTYDSYQTVETSPCYVLKNTSALQNGVKLVTGDVDRIGNFAFEGCGNLTSVIISNSVTSIGNQAFYGCGNLTSATISNSVTSIGIQAFYNCRNLTSVTIPNNVTSIGYWAFAECNSLSRILVNEHNANYSSDGVALYNKEESLLIAVPGGVTSFVIPNSVTSIGACAFFSCESLTSVTIPDSVTSIGTQAFSNCRQLSSITIPGSVTSIGENTFLFCSSLNDITFAGTVEQWNAISKNIDWKRSAVPANKIVCTDGTVTLRLTNGTIVIDPSVSR